MIHPLPSMIAAAVSIDSTTPVAEFFAAPATHVIASVCLLDPKIAEGAHFVLCPSDKL